MKNPTSFYLRLAQVIAMESKAERLKVGALLVRNDNIVSFGYNGTPKGFNNECETKTLMFGTTELVTLTKPEVLHAESNAIAKCAKSVQSSEGCTLYTTHSPCFECCKLIIQAGIIEVIYLSEFRDTSGLELLKQAHIPSLQRNITT